ncbi:uncharacterized protein LOC111897406 [Lactuca sativa]|uniref:uncharacterized protein LOC111897406 n=1 Tax=Lactuca sativa TaxID=4236 RepID=UPI000CD8485F|nr:uncharacterized protein LOC111897406 [Lactuca sativa]
MIEDATKEEKKEDKTTKKKPFITESKATPAPFPERLKSTKKEREESEIMRILNKFQINIPLLEAIKQVPRYERFLKDLCVSKKNKRKPNYNSRGKRIRDFAKEDAPKCKDPSLFTVPCKLGNLDVPRAMLDLGTLSKTGVIIQLADRSIVHPNGVLEDVLVQINEFVFPTYFYVLDMGDDDSPISSSILLGRPFLKTSITKIDVYNETLTMEFDELVLSRKLDRNKAKELAKEFDINNEVLEILEFIDDKKHMWIDEMKSTPPTTKVKPLPPVEQAQDSGSKTLPEPLKNIHIEKEGTQPVINSNKLSKKEENELIIMLNKYQIRTEWTISDIKDLSPFWFVRKKKAKGRL